jgi:hypothetical protein
MIKGLRKNLIYLIFGIIVLGCGDSKGPNDINLDEYDNWGGIGPMVLYKDPELTYKQQYDAYSALYEHSNRFTFGSYIVYMGPEMTTEDFCITSVPRQTLVAHGQFVTVSGHGPAPSRVNVVVTKGPVNGYVPMGPGVGNLGAYVVAKKPYSTGEPTILVSIDDGSGVNSIPHLYKMLHYYYNQVLVDRMPKGEVEWYKRWAEIHAIQWDINETIRQSR